MSDRTVNSQQICWICQKACGGCKRSKKLQPVDGWVANRWINVKDDLPDEDVLVLLYDKHLDYVGVGYYDNHRDCWIDNCIYEGECWADDCIYEPDEYENVTHWMPLPEPPQESEM